MDDRERQYRLNAALQNRMVMAEAEKKKRKKVKGIIIAIIVLAMALLMVNAIIKSAYRGELRNMVTDEMDEHFTNVYVDVVSIEPVYFVYHYETSKYGATLGNGDIWDVVCKCKTVEGKVIWANFFYQYYPEGNYSRNENDYKPFTFSADNPMRLTGKIDMARQIIEELEVEIGNVYVLNVNDPSDEM